ncbi:MAG: class I SAM-dependent methyltransferase [Nitrospira sp.]|nr:class I SAM-dependent methyltransferase [bacterium]MBL7049612.1 class I SAM-dependent methyltransferase [Nitrospira sp.]
MKRIQEPDLMDTTEQAEAYAAADFSGPHNAFVSHFIDKFSKFTTGNILDMGCGTGDVIMRFARSLPEVHITGIDGSDAMLIIASREISRHKMSSRIKLRKSYIPDPELSQKKYDAVISNSLLHHMNTPEKMWQTINETARDGAPILIMDLMRPANEDKVLEYVNKYAADAPAILQEDFHNSLLAAYTLDEVSTQLHSCGLGYLRVENISDRHLLVGGVFNG